MPSITSLPKTDGNIPQGVHQKYQPCTCARNNERVEVLLVHIGHDAEHLRPVDDQPEHCAVDNEERERNPCPHRRIRTAQEEREDVSSSSSSSSWAPRKLRSGPPSSVPPPSSFPPPRPTCASRWRAGGGTGGQCRRCHISLETMARQRRHSGSHVTDRDCTLPAAPAPSGRRAAAPNWLSSVPVGRSSLHAPHHGCDEGLQPVPVCRSCFNHERSRRCRLRAAAVAVPTPTLVDIMKAQLKSHQHKTEQPV